MSIRTVLIIHHGHGVGGGLIALQGLIKDLNPHYRVRVLCIFNSEAVEHLKKAGVEVQVAQSQFFKRYYDLFVHSEASFPSLLGEIRKARNLILYLANAFYFAPKTLQTLNFEYDIVYLNSIFLTDWARAAHRLQKKIVLHVREPLAAGALGFRYQIIRRAIRKYANKVIAISKDNARRLNLPNITTQIYDPVHLQLPTKQLSEIDVNYRYFTYLGGSQRIKGFETLVDCLPYLHKNIRIFFLGYDYELQNIDSWKFIIRRAFSPYDRRLPSLRDAIQNSKHIIKIGMSHDVANYYGASLALISPFAKPHASLPIIECLSIGKPVIASDVAGTEELTDNSTGLMFRHGDAKSLALAINEMSIQSREQMEAFSVACCKKFRTIFEKNPLVIDEIEKL